MAETADAGEKDRIVGLLEQEWGAIADLLDGLPAEAWARPALPGWDVHDVVAHMLSGELMLGGAPRPEVEVDPDTPHVHNDIARLNEAWVVSLRDVAPAEMARRFREVTGERVAALSAMTADDFAAPSWTPVGQATYGRFMLVRVFDAWMHEQDIRVAAGVPGHEDGPVAEAALDEVVGALGYIVGKRAAMPDGTALTIHLTGPIRRDLHVMVDGRARAVDALEGPATVTIALSSSLFLRLAGGRTDPEAALAEVELGGDEALARRLATSLAYTI